MLLSVAGLPQVWPYPQNYWAMMPLSRIVSLTKHWTCDRYREYHSVRSSYRTSKVKPSGPMCVTCVQSGKHVALIWDLIWLNHAIHGIYFPHAHSNWGLQKTGSPWPVVSLVGSPLVQGLQHTPGRTGNGWVGVGGMMKLIVSQWVIPENSLRSSAQVSWRDRFFHYFELGPSCCPQFSWWHWHSFCDSTELPQHSSAP